MEAIFYTNLILQSPINDKTGIDAFEVHPCVVVDEVGGVKSYEQCEENDPDIAIWGLYVHFEGGGLECIADCKTKGDAEQLEAALKLICKTYKPS